MCNASGIVFGVKNLNLEEIKGKKIIEVGAYDVNGSLRPIIESWAEPSEYIGVDIVRGHGVDVVCMAERMINVFGKERFDIVICTELIEHVRDWKKVVSNIKNICKPNGVIIITTRSKGFKYHGFPYDFWRYELHDLKKIFSDCEIITLENDTAAPGVFLKAKKPVEFIEKDLTTYKLFNVVVDKEVTELKDIDLSIFIFLRKILSGKKKRLHRFLFKTIRFFSRKNRNALA